MPLNMKKVPLPTIPPVQAAIELRQLAKSALKQSTTEDIHSLEGARLRLRKAGDCFKSFTAHNDTTNLNRMEVSAAIESRRVKAGRVNLERMQTSLSNERFQVREMKRLIDRAMDYLADNQPKDTTYILVPRHAMERINQLAQCFPTSEEIPTGREQNIIRAIIAILRANDVQGLEGLTEKGAENGNEQSAASVSNAVGQVIAAAVAANVATADGDTDGPF